MWPLAYPAPKLLNQPGLADAGLADDQDELPFAGESVLRAASQDAEVLLTADKRRGNPRSFSAPSAAYPYDAIGASLDALERP